MCGIAGIASVRRPDAALVRRMCDSLVHRGPDGFGLHEDDGAAVGMRRLAIVDVAGSQQPVYNEDRTVAAVFNGELYNFRELREGLRRRGHRFTTRGDSECLVHLYEDYGDDLVHQLRGMFAFAIWDAAARRLLLARDRVGKKPLYWRDDGMSLAFGSELKALVADPALHRRIDPVALHHYLTYQYVPAPWSIYQDVQKLPPGHLLAWQDGVTKVSRYWKLDCYPAADRLHPRSCRAAEGLAAGRDQGADAQRASAGRVPLGRHRFVRGGGRDGPAGTRTGQDLLRRVRRRAVRRASSRPPAGPALWNRSSRIRRDVIG